MFDFFIYLISQLISLYALIMLVYCLLSWVIRDPSNRLMTVLSIIAEPPLHPIKKFLWRFDFFRRSPVDFSPVILFFLLRLLVSALAYLARMF